MLSQYYYKLQTTIGYFRNLIAFFNVWINLFPIIPDKSSFKNFFLTILFNIFLNYFGDSFDINKNKMSD